MVTRYKVAVVCLACFASIAFGANDSGQLFSELFKAVTNALAASGGSGQTRQDPYGYQTGITASVYNALQTISKNDDLECVPRLLCEAVAGGKPGGSRDLNLDKYSLSKLISFLELDPTRSSPMLAFGKAIVLGLSNRGDPYSCIINYPKCPKDQTRLLYYLNNHRGGFFRFFDMKLPHQNYQYGQTSYYTRYETGSKPSGYYPYKSGVAKPVKYAGETYAKKYTHSRVSFPGKKEGNRMVFPASRGEHRIQTKVVGDAEYVVTRPGDNGDRFVFSKQQRYGKKLTDLEVYVPKPVHFVTDRLPSKFYFPDNTYDGDKISNNVKVNNYGHRQNGLFFPKN